MKIISTTQDDATIAISYKDLAYLYQGMREMLVALRDSELRTRTGETPERARELMEDVGRVCEAIRNHKEPVPPAPKTPKR